MKHNTNKLKSTPMVAASAVICGAFLCPLENLRANGYSSPVKTPAAQSRSQPAPKKRTFRSLAPVGLNTPKLNNQNQYEQPALQRAQPRVQPPLQPQANAVIYAYTPQAPAIASEPLALSRYGANSVAEQPVAPKMESNYIEPPIPESTKDGTIYDNAPIEGMIISDQGYSEPAAVPEMIPAPPIPANSAVDDELASMVYETKVAEPKKKPAPKPAPKKSVAKSSTSSYKKPSSSKSSSRSRGFFGRRSSSSNCAT